MTASLLSLAVGGAVGAIFSFFKLPIPAPITFTGVLGIVGVWAGYTIISKVLGS
jgi:XapX domain-containing protein